MFLLFGASFFGPLLFPVLIALVTFVFYKRISERQREDEQIRLLRLRRQNEVVAAGGPKKIFTRKRKEIDYKSQSKSPVCFSGVTVFYGTKTGKSKLFSEELLRKVQKLLPASVVELSQIEPEENLLELKTQNVVCAFILPTHTDGTPPKSAAWFFKWLSEAANDFRFEKNTLKGLKYVIFGLGNSQYGDNYNIVAKQVDVWLNELGAQRLMPLSLGDEDPAGSEYGSLEMDFQHWCDDFTFLLTTGPNTKTSVNKMLQEHSVTPEEEQDNDDDDGNLSDGMLDMEDLGLALQKQKNKSQAKDKEMITSALRQALTKQGYRLVGTHSGVKMCRWTKSMLRGRGGCYKHTFYGIESHRCMEATPSLACANKCVFCWRHHTNPVGTEWKWKMDKAEEILEGALKNHYALVNQFKGVPGVIPERLAEGLQAKHCALSLVGEPIMYPEINEFIKLLHSKGISTFLVTNAQFPEAIRELSPVTQLYVSVDASTKDSLKKIDRPLFRDFWERFVDSLKALKSKGQRTVYRLTLVKAWNVEELQSYAQLVSLGNPDFIELKGVTYCGGNNNKENSLTMENVPWHEEVVSFASKLAGLLPDYAIASEHEHSNCVLIAHKKFYIEGEWWTWIDYDKFQELVSKYSETDGAAVFESKGYMKRTPDWAVYGAKEQGFDPVETRWHRHAGKNMGGC